MRTEYRNGDAVTLVHCGCDGCSPAMVNGILCHENGCPDAWRDRLTECKWCGSTFYRQDRWQAFCDDECAEAYSRTPPRLATR